MRYPLLLILVFTFSFVSRAKAQSLGWADLFGLGTGYGPQISDMKADQGGNLIVAGRYEPGCSLNGKALPQSKFSIAQGYVCFLAKFDTAGHLLWMDTTSAVTEITHIEISENGDYFFSGLCSFIGTPFNAPNHTALNSEGFIGKCDGNGKMDWVRKYLDYSASNNNGGIGDFRVDAAENIYFVTVLPGYPDYFKIDTTKYDYKPGRYSFAYCALKFDSSGHLLWLAPKLPSGTTNYNQIDIDGTGNFYVSLDYFDLDNRKQTSAIYKFDDNGNLAKEFAIDTNGFGGISSISVDNLKNIYISCTVSDTMDFLHQVNTGKFYNGIAKLDSNFNPVWTLYVNGRKAGILPFVNKKTNALYALGIYGTKISLGGHSTQNNLGDTLYNLFFAKFDPKGRVNWFANTTYSQPTDNLIPFIQDNCGNLFISFDFASPLHFKGLNFNPGLKYAAVIAKFSSDSLSFINQNSRCGLSLKNTSNPVYTQFQWYAKDTSDTTIGKLIATSRDLYYLFPHKHKYIITLLAIKSGGCTNTVQDTFSIPGSPVAGFTAIDTQGCQYVQFLFSDTSHADTINAALGQSWSWNFGDSASSGMNSRLTYFQTKRPIVSHVYTQSGTYTVTLVYGNGLCTDTFTSQKKVVIIPAPRPGFTVSDTVGCAPLSVHVTDGSVGQVVGWVYVVKKIPLPPSKGDSLRTPSFSYYFPSPGQYIIHQYLTGTTGCVTEDSAMVNVTPVFSATDSMDVSDVTVDSVAPPAIDIKWAAYPGAFNYELYRYTDKDTSTTVLLTQTYDTSYIDYNNLDPARHTYTYYLKAQDGCGNFTSAGLVGRTIKLSGSEGQDLLPSLAWNPYIQWKNGVKTYQVYRQNPGSNFTLLGSVADTFYTDTGFITDETYNDCYKVTALSKTDNYTSTSYIFCFSQSPQIFIPNIFTPNGDTLNDYFAPVCMGIKSYTMTIINRWGEKVYTTSPPAPSPLTSPQPAPGGEGAGWDGSFKGTLSPNGIYIYYIKAEDYNGNTIIRKGMVMLQK